MTSSKLGIDNQTGETVYLHKASRRQGTYFIAATGVGKSTSLRYLIEQDIKQGIGVCVLDPHGDLINDVIGSLHRREDRDRVLLLDAQDKYRKFGINLYQCDDPTDDELVTNTYDRVEHIFKLVWGEDIAHMPLVMQGIQNSTYTFIDSSPAYNCTMLEVPMLFREMTPRAHMVGHLRDDNIQSWWKYYNDSPQGTKDELARMVVNKVEGFTTNRLLRPIIGQSRSTVDFRQVIDSTDGKIVLIKMFGNNEKLTQLIGSLVIAQLLGAALSREDKARDERRQFHIYADEFELYATEDFTRLLKECRKYGMGVTLAHQSREDISNRNKAASLQVANIIVGRVIPDDAKDIAGMFDTTPGTVETRYEYIRTPTHKPVDFIVSGKSHPNEVVNTILGKWKGVVERANESIHDLRIPAGTDRWGKQQYDFVSNEYLIRQAQQGVQLMNDLLYKVMLEKNPFQAVRVYLCLWVAKEFSLPFYRVLDGTGYLSVFLPEELGKAGDALSPAMIEAYTQLWLVPDEQLDQAFETFHAHVLEAMKMKYRLKLENYFQWLYEQFEIHDEPYEILKLNRAAKKNPASKAIEPIRDKPYFNYWSNEQLGVTRPMKYPGVDWSHGYDLEKREEEFEVEKGIIPFEQLTYEKKGLYSSFYGNTLSSYLSPHDKELVGWTEEDNRLVIQGYYWRLKPGILEEHIDVILDPVVKVGLRGRESFTAFIRELRALMQALATQPIEDISGVVEEKPGTQRTYQDMQNEIASKLVKQPVGVAWCRVQNATGGLEEHVIQLTISTTRLAETNEVEQWIEDIKERMLNIDGCLRSITDVEKEISERHALLRLPPKPPAPPLLPDKPDEPPGSPRRKKIA